MKEIGAKLQLSFCKESVIMSKVWEDNTGTIRLAEAAHKVTFHTKHLAVKFHLFRSHLSDEVRVQKVDTTEQLADVFTKGLAQHQFEKLVARLMGWEVADGQQWLPSGHYSGIESA